MNMNKEYRKQEHYSANITKQDIIIESILSGFSWD